MEAAWTGNSGLAFCVAGVHCPQEANARPLRRPETDASLL